MKKYIKIFLLFFIIFISFTCAHADTGPKPSINVTINGDTSGMYMSLLSKDKSHGPWSAEHSYITFSVDEEIINQKFINYQDSDGFYYQRFLQKIENHTFNWTYYPPNTFKFLIYDSINDKFITNNVIYQKEEFKSIYTLSLANNSIVIGENNNSDTEVNNSIVVEKNNNFGTELLSFFVRLAICLTIEVLVGFLFGLRKFEFIPILIINLITQVAFNLILTIYIHQSGFNLMAIIPIYIACEIVIFVVECIFNTYFVKYVDKKCNINIKTSLRIILYTITANIASLGLGFVILTYLH